VNTISSNPTSFILYGSMVPIEPPVTEETPTEDVPPDDEDDEIIVNLFSLIDSLKLTGSRLLMLNPNDLMNEYYPFQLNRFDSERIINEINETFYTIHKESLQNEIFECMEPDDIIKILKNDDNSKEKHEEDSKYPLLDNPSMYLKEYTCESCGTHEGFYMCFLEICKLGYICAKCLTCDTCSTKYKLQRSPFHEVD